MINFIFGTDIVKWYRQNKEWFFTPMDIKDLEYWGMATPEGTWVTMYEKGE